MGRVNEEDAVAARRLVLEVPFSVVFANG